MTTCHELSTTAPPRQASANGVHTSPLSLTPEEAGALAWVLIDTIMQARFGPATSLYDTWRRAHPRRNQDPVAGPTHHRVVRRAGVWTARRAEKSEHHLHGHVGEWLWHLLTKDNPAVRVQPDPKGDVTDAGGDGFSIYENTAGALRFRLWESKKNTGSGSLSDQPEPGVHAACDLRPAVRRQDRRHVRTRLPRHSDETIAFISRGARRVDPR